MTFGLAVTVGNMIGAGIFRSPGDIAEQLPTVGLYFAVWIIGGAYALLGANALAELGTAVPRSGGQYVFVREALGDYGGFVVGWSDWISTCGTTAAVAITLGEYALILWPQFRAVQVVALLVIALLTIVQWAGIRWGGAAQDATSFAKGAGFILFIAACFWLGGRNPAAQGIVGEREGSLLVAFIVALQMVIYTYDGWSAVIYFSEEVKEPARNIPRSMFGGVVAVMAIYLVLNAAFLRVVPLATIAREKLPVAVVAHHLFGFDGDNITRILAIVALLSAVNSNVLMAPRVVFAMARDRLFWRGAAEVNRGGTPDVALLISSAIAAVFVMWGGFERVVAILAFFFVANYTLSFTSLFVLRRRQPDAPRGFRAIGHPLTTGLALVASVAFLIGTIAGDLKTALWALGVLVASVPVYLLIRK